MTNREPIDLGPVWSETEKELMRVSFDSLSDKELFAGLYEYEKLRAEIEDIDTLRLDLKQVVQLLKYVYWMDLKDLHDIYDLPWYRDEYKNGNSARIGPDDYITEKWGLLKKDPVIWMLDLDNENFERLVRTALSFDQQEEQSTNE